MKWNIEGIADSVIEEMQEDSADISELDYYLRQAMWSVFSREPEKAASIIEKVEILIMEKLEE